MKAADWNDVAKSGGTAAVLRAWDGLPADAPPVNDDPPGDSPRIVATPFNLRPEAEIPPRDFIFARHLIRRYVSVVAAASGVGKTALLVATALSGVTGRNFLGWPIYGGPLRCWLWNLEDPADELERRLAAACQHYGIGADDIGDRLFVDSGRDQALCIARQDRDGTRVLEPVVDALVAELVRRRIDVLIVDPFVSCHSVAENDNGAIDMVAKAWGRVAERANCSVLLVHHVRKLNGAEVEVDSIRGGGSLVAAARVAQVLATMTKDEAERAGLDTHRGYFRVEDGKANLSPPADDSKWIHLESVRLANGDDVAVVEPWQWPDALDGLSVADLLSVQKAVADGLWRQDAQAGAWAGRAVAAVLGLDADDKSDKARIKSLLRTWIGNGALKVVDDQDEARKIRKFVVVGEWAATP